MRTTTHAATRSYARSSLRVIAPLALTIAALVPAASSLAQPNNQNKRDPNELIAPQPTPPSKTPSTVAGTLIALLLAGIVLGVNCIPSKRGHQD